MAAVRKVNSFLPDFFDQKGFFNSIGPVVVNVNETETTFYIDMLVPGFLKRDFTLRIDNGILTVSAKRNIHDDLEHAAMLNQSPVCYERSFNLPSNSDENDINARFDSGILKISIAKKGDAPSQIAKDIEIK